MLSCSLPNRQSSGRAADRQAAELAKGPDAVTARSRYCMQHALSLNVDTQCVGGDSGRSGREPCPCGEEPVITVTLPSGSIRTFALSIRRLESRKNDDGRPGHLDVARCDAQMASLLAGSACSARSFLVSIISIALLSVAS